MKLWLIILCFLYSVSIFGKPVEIDKGQEIVDLTEYESIFYSTEEATVTDVIEGDWESSESGKDFGANREIKWVRYEFHNSRSDSLNNFIYIPYHHITRIDVYQKSASGISLVTKTGTARNPDVKNLDARGYPIKIKFPPGVCSVIIRFEHKHLPLHASAFFMSNKQVKKILAKNMNIIWFWHGVFSVALLFSLVLFIASKKKIFLYYFLFNVGGALSIGSEIGDFMWLLGADVHGRVLDIKMLGNVFTMIFFPAFVNTFTPVKQIHPKLWKAMRAGALFAIILLIINCFPKVKESNLLSFIFFYFFIFTAGIFFFHLYLLLIASIKKQRNALELFVVYGLYLLVVTIIIILPTFGLKGDGIFTYNILLFCSIGEVLVFLILIGANAINLFRLNNELLEKEKLHQQEIIKAVVDSQEIERNKIGQEMHDLIGASIALVRNNVAPENKPILKLIDDTIATIKSISNGLMTPRVKDGDFEEEIKNLCSLSSGNKMKVQYYFHQWPELKKYDISTHIYRIVQELLHNAMRHSNASKVHVQFLKRENDLCVLYEDNGKGLTYDTSRKIGRGLMGIENRVQLIQGKLHIDSGAKNGLSIMIEIKNHTL